MDLELKSPAHGKKSSNLSLAELIGQLAMIKAIKISRKRKIRRTAVAVWVGRDFVCVDARAHVVVDVYIWLQFRRLISTMIPCVLIVKANPGAYGTTCSFTDCSVRPKCFICLALVNTFDGAGQILIGKKGTKGD